jgi:uncharacterized protein (TIGR02284 family)
MSNDDVIDTLNDLIEISKDGEYGFTAAAEHAKAPELRALLAQRAGDCAQGARELQSHVEQLGGKPDTGGSAGGAMHRGWVSVKATLAGHTDLGLLEECERGEDKALARYRDACKEALPPAVLAVVERQRQGVQANHDQIRDLRNRLRETA